MQNKAEMLQDIEKDYSNLFVEHLVQFCV